VSLSNAQLTGFNFRTWNNVACQIKRDLLFADVVNKRCH
jgi:hypothetical protein